MTVSSLTVIAGKPARPAALSGGLDSYTAGAIARADGFDAARADRALRADARARGRGRARRRACAGRRASRRARSSICGHRRVGADRCRAVPKDRPLDADDIPSTYVPARNTIFLSLALAWAETLDADATSSSGSTRSTIRAIRTAGPSTSQAFERLASLATRAGVEGGRFRIHTPLIELSKAEIIRRGVGLGSRLRPDAQLLRPAARRPAVRSLRQLPCCVRRASRKRALADPLSPEPYADSAPRALSHDAACTTPIPLDWSSPAACRASSPRAIAGTSCSTRPRSTRRRGGQPYDTGTLGYANVVDVFEEDDGRVVHVVDRELPSRSGCRRACRWTPAPTDHRSSTRGSTCCRRRSSACTESRTVSFHLGSVASTIDLAREVTPVRSRRPRTRRTASCGRTGRSPSGSCQPRKPPRSRCGRSRCASGELRLIDIADFDLSACGGTARGADRRDWPHRRARLGALQGRLAARVRVRRPRAGDAARTARGDDVRRRACCRCCPNELAGRRSRSCSARAAICVVRCGR